MEGEPPSGKARGGCGDTAHTKDEGPTPAVDIPPRRRISSEFRLSQTELSSEGCSSNRGGVDFLGD